MRQSKKALAVALLAALTLGVACGGQSSAATIALSEFTIRPKGVTLKAGRPATLTFVNAGKVEHNFKLDPSVSDVPLLAVLKPGESTTVTFTPKSAGAFRYACTIPGHAPAGMTGTLAVKE